MFNMRVWGLQLVFCACISGNHVAQYTITRRSARRARRLQRRQAARKTQFDADKAAFDAERQVFAARLADLEAAERVWQMLSGDTRPGDNAERSRPSVGVSPTTRSLTTKSDDDAQGGYQTHKDLVLEAIQRLGSRRKGLARALSG